MDQVGLNVLLDLKRKSRITNVSGRWAQEHYALFSKSGFTPELRAVANCEDVRLVEVEQILSDIRARDSLRGPVEDEQIEQI